MPVLAQKISQTENVELPPPQSSTIATATVPDNPSLTPKKKIPTILIFLLIILLFFTGVIGSFFYFLSKDKKALGLMAEDQVKNFTNLQNNYQQIVIEVRKTDQKENQPVDTRLLKTESLENDQRQVLQQIEEKVLGIEDTLELQLARTLKQLYQEASNTNQKINEQNEKVIKKAGVFPLLLATNNVSSLTNQTADFSKDTERILEFLGQDETIAIELLAWIDDFNLVLQMAIINNSSEQSIAKLEEKLKELKQMEVKYNLLTTSGLPVYLIEYKRTSDAQIKLLREILVEIKDAVATKDTVALILALEKLELEAYGTTNSSMVEWITFWQENETIQETNTLKEDWQQLQQTSGNIF